MTIYRLLTVRKFAFLAAILVLGPSCPRIDAAQPCPTDNRRPDSSVDRIHKALDQLTELKFEKTPLSEVAASLRARFNIPVVLDQQSLDDLGLTVDEPMTCAIRGIKLRSALRLMLRDMDLSFIIRNESLVITSNEEAEEHVTTEVYPIWTLVTSASESDWPMPQPDYDPLIEMVTSVIRPTTWSAGTGSTDLCTFCGVLVLGQSQEAQEEIAAFIGALHKAFDPSRTEDSAPSYAPIDVGDTTAAKRILKTLRQPIDIDCRDMPLKKVLALLSQKHGIDIQLDQQSFDDLGVLFETAVTFQANGISLRAGLELMLGELDLTWTILHDVLLIVSQEAASEFTVIRLYPVRDLITKAEELTEDGQSLCQVVESWERDSWADVGGTGVVQLYRDVLVCSQTWVVHEKIEKLLARLRSEIDSQPIAAVAAEDPEQVVTRVHRIDQPKEKSWHVPESELVSLIQELFDPDSWDGNGGPYIVRGIPRALVVRHNIKMHDRIDDFLDVLGLIGRGGFGGGLPKAGGVFRVPAAGPNPQLK